MLFVSFVCHAFFGLLFVYFCCQTRPSDEDVKDLEHDVLIPGPTVCDIFCIFYMFLLNSLTKFYLNLPPVVQKSKMFPHNQQVTGNRKDPQSDLS